MPEHANSGEHAEPPPHANGPEHAEAVRHGNWIGGEWIPARFAHTFEPDAGSESGARARFPRSSAADVDAALAACARARAQWSARSVDERRAVLVEAARQLARDPDPGGLLAAALGASRDELAQHARDLARQLEHDLARERDRSRGRTAPSMRVCAPHWSELWLAPAREILGALLSGSSIVLLSDRHAPFLAEAIARSLDAASLAPGVLALLHDDGDACLNALLAHEEVDVVSVAAPRARIREIERRAQRLRARSRPDPAPARGPSAAERAARLRFGSGVDDRPGPVLDARCLRNATYMVNADADPDAAAREVVARAFGRSQALSGQLPGSIGRVACHERSFSRFSAALLERLDRDADVARPLCALDPATLEHARRARELGLDEGATLVFSRPKTRASDDAGGEQASRERRPEAILWPTVFTNVEEHMRLAWLGRPAPVLCLMRVPSDERGAAMARDLDGDPLAEDLSERAEDRTAEDG
jgi:acyl-CoA reductase-like NAD-dependent aldehyde dehydrogenase